ncbi:MAG: hypothetical protein E4G74_02005 [Erysipelotrichales bacterium]|nr:MAG: hypothetical protein E4G74_02005 [Erysipelotrichales bacterium]
MAQQRLHLLIKEIAVKSAELLECIQWSAMETDRKNARKVTLELSALTQELLKELDKENLNRSHIV